MFEKYIGYNDNSTFWVIIYSKIDDIDSTYYISND